MATQNIPVDVMNAQILDSLEREDGVKKAQAAATDYTRTQIREESFAFKIIPPEKATDYMLDRDLTENLGIIWELEPDSPGAKWVPFQTVPEGEYIVGSRYKIPFARVETPKFTKDIDELRTTRQDIRKILTDNSIKDGLAEIDSKFISTVNTIVLDAPGPGKPNNLTGKVQWIDFKSEGSFDGNLNRQNFALARNMLPTGNAEGKFRLRNYISLMNETTAGNLLRYTRNEVGGDLAQTFFTDGLTIDKFMGVKTLFTIKDDLVPDGYVYFFAEPAFLGKCFYLHDWTMFLKKEAFFIEFFSYWLGGMAIGNVAGVALARFDVPTIRKVVTPGDDTSTMTDVTLTGATITGNVTNGFSAEYANGTSDAAVVAITGSTLFKVLAADGTEVEDKKIAVPAAGANAVKYTLVYGVNANNAKTAELSVTQANA